MTEKGVACFAFQIRMNLCMRPTKEPACLFLSSGFCSSFITLSSACQHRNFQNHQLPILFLPDISDQSPCSRHDKIKNSALKLNNQLLQFINKNLKSILHILVGGNCLCFLQNRFLSGLIFPRCSIPCTICFPVCNINLTYLGLHPLFAIANSWSFHWTQL